MFIDWFREIGFPCDSYELYQVLQPTHLEPQKFRVPILISINLNHLVGSWHTAHRPNMLPERIYSSHGSLMILHLPRPFEHYDSSSSRCLPHLSVWQQAWPGDLNPLRERSDSPCLRRCAWKGPRGTLPVRFLISLSVTYLTNLFQQWRLENGREEETQALQNPAKFFPSRSLSYEGEAEEFKRIIPGPTSDFPTREWSIEPAHIPGTLLSVWNSRVSPYLLNRPSHIASVPPTKNSGLRFHPSWYFPPRYNTSCQRW